MSRQAVVKTQKFISHLPTFLRSHFRIYSSKLEEEIKRKNNTRSRKINKEGS